MHIKAHRFSFKSEAVWTIIFAAAPPIVGVLILLTVWLLRR
jgi:hypothetical protein